MDDKTRRLAPFRAARDGATAIEFAFIFPILAVLTLGVLELALIVFDYHRAGEAMRSAVRAFEIDPAVTSFATLPMTCPGGAACDATRINAVIADINGTLPQVGLANLQITYDQSGLDVAATPGVVTPVITVSIIDLQHDFFILSAIVPGIPASFTFPAFSTSRVVQSVVK